MTPAGSTKTWALGLRDTGRRGASPGRKQGVPSVCSEGDDNPSQGPPPRREGGKREAGARVKSRDAPTRTSLLRQQLVQERFKGQGTGLKAPPAPSRGKTSAKSRYSQSSGRRGKSPLSEEEGDVMRAVTKDVIKELQREREVSKRAPKDALRKVGVVTASRASSVGSDELPPPRRAPHGVRRHPSPVDTVSSFASLKPGEGQEWAPTDGGKPRGAPQAHPYPLSHTHSHARSQTVSASPTEGEGGTGRWSAELFKAGMIAAASPGGMDEDDDVMPAPGRLPAYEV